MQNLSHRTIETIKRMNGRVCPECGMGMTEVERAEEGDYLFIWYECYREDCSGQWLEKKMLVSEKCFA